MATALTYPDLVKRCTECYGSVRIHRAGPGGVPSSHAEHRIGHAGCSLAQGFDGRRRRHPRPARPPRKQQELVVLLAEEEPTPESFAEGATQSVTVNSYERDPRARRACLAHHGYTCCVCNQALEELCGPTAKRIIHVHHIVPLSEVDGQYVVDPVEDLVPICPNCHAVVHSKRPPLEVREVQRLLRGARGET